jgi:2-isopropylmalate synthase
MKNRVTIFDTTLRDGEQSAGVAFTVKQKLEIARQLERLGVNVIEAGFPRTSPGDMEAVKAIAREVRGLTVCALARAVKDDIDAAWEGIKHAADPRIHVFINTSDIQMAHQLRKSREDVLSQAEAMVRRAAAHTGNVEFSPMDATRSDRGFLCEIVERCIAAGATTINIPDSVGYSMPAEIEALFREIISTVPNSNKAVFSTHAHNDLGLSTANTLSAVRGGARQVEVTVNGIGERAGNASLEEVAMGIETRGDFYGLRTTINTREIYHTSKLVENCSGMNVQWNKAIVGKNAFRHGSGIHQDGILKHRQTWEIMDPEKLGIPQGTQLVMGKLSGRHAFKRKIDQLGYQLSELDADRAFDEFKKLGDRKASIDDRDIEAIIAEQFGEVDNPAWTLDHVQIVAGDKAAATATIRLTDADGAHKQDAAIGAGPVDAIYQAVNRITGHAPRLTEFSIQSITEGLDAQGEVTIRIENGGRTHQGRGSHTDILVASARAYINALNRMIGSSNGRPLQDLEKQP